MVGRPSACQYALRIVYRLDDRWFRLTRILCAVFSSWDVSGPVAANRSVLVRKLDMLDAASTLDTLRTSGQETGWRR